MSPWILLDPDRGDSTWDPLTPMETGIAIAFVEGEQEQWFVRSDFKMGAGGLRAGRRSLLYRGNHCEGRDACHRG